MVDDNPPHQLRGDGEKMPAVLPVHRPLGEELEVGLVDDGRRVEPVVAPLAGELARGQDFELVVDDRHEAVERFPVA